MQHAISRRQFTTFTLGAGALLAAGMSPMPRRRATNAFEWAELRKGQAWVTGGSSTGGNVLVVQSKGQVLMVDAKFAGISPLLRSEAEARAGAPITMLVNTHHHGDHTGGNAAFASAEGYAHAAAVLRISKQLDAYKAQLDNASDAITKLAGDDAQTALKLLPEIQSRIEAEQINAFIPKNTIDHYPLILHVGDLRVDLYHFGPGHTDNDVVVHIPELDIVHVGDLHFNGLHPYYDTNGGVSTAGWIRSIEQARRFCFGNTVVIPGHGPLGDDVTLQKQIVYFNQLIKNVSFAMKQGKPKEEISKMSWSFMDGLGFEQIRSRAIEAVYDELDR